jgi:hypothetical protein
MPALPPVTTLVLPVWDVGWEGSQVESLAMPRP